MINGAWRRMNPITGKKKKMNENYAQLEDKFT